MTILDIGEDPRRLGRTDTIRILVQVVRLVSGGGSEDMRLGGITEMLKSGVLIAVSVRWPASQHLLLSRIGADLLVHRFETIFYQPSSRQHPRILTCMKAGSYMSSRECRND
jgi:hypothetical protein